MKNKFFIIGSLFLFLGFILSSWILIHVLAVVGIFLAVAYPIWWFFLPKQTVCFFCRAKREGAFCPLCRRKITKSEGVAPSTFTSAMLNGSMLFLFAIVSLGVVLGESQLLSYYGFSSAQKSVSFVIPQEKQYRLGEIFPMKVEIMGIKVPINAVQADIRFDPRKVELVEISTQGSFANVFIQKEINNKEGYARLTGGIPNPGFLSDKGIFNTLYFKGKEAGLVNIEFLPTSLVLANDGKGSNVLKDFATASYLILPEMISAEEESLQKKAFLNKNVLGTDSEHTQFTFYDESKVLSVYTSREREEKVMYYSSMMEMLEKVDTFILSHYARLDAILFNDF